MSFENLGLSAALLRAVAEQGYTEPTPIQARVIPVVLEGRDVMAGAHTGTGKTAGFTLPLLQRLSASTAPQGGKRPVRALILTPTRELAAQVAESVRVYGQFLPLKSAVIFGGVSINPQIDALRRGVDIVIGTPGRLLDHAQQRTLDLRQVETFVLDEADRMLDMGFLPDIRRVISLLPQKRQNLLFSATFPDDIRSLANKMLQSPVSVEVGQRNASPPKIEQAVYFVDKGQKRGLLSWLIGSGNWRQVLVFTRTKHGANRLAEQLEQRLGAAAIHGNRAKAHARASRLQTRGCTRARSHRHRGPRSRHRSAAARRELRAARGARALRPSDRPHRPSRQRRPRDIVGRQRRATAAEVHRAIARTPAAATVARRLQAGPAARGSTRHATASGLCQQPTGAQRRPAGSRDQPPGTARRPSAP
jgi:hypothetical protein